MKEIDILRNCLIEASKDGLTLWRNNVGCLQAKDGTYVRYGVGNPGGSDLIGITPMTITTDLVGKTIGVFTAIEVKMPDKNPTQEQKNFISFVKKQGGIAGVVRDKKDLKKVVDMVCGQWHDDTTKGDPR